MYMSKKSKEMTIMMNIKKMGLILLSVAVLALIFTACAAGPEDTNSTTATTATTAYHPEDGTGYGPAHAPGQGQGQ